MMLKEIRYIQNVGRFQTAKPACPLSFNRCCLVFGENGWGKSTIADLLRSLTKNDPVIVKGRITLPAGTEQKVVLRFDASTCVLENGKWQGGEPHIAVYDSVFVNENVYSGDNVSADHMKNQYGLVVGEEGVSRVRRLVELDDDNRKNNEEIRNLEAQLTASMRSVGPQSMKLDEFLSLQRSDDIDAAIAEKIAEVNTARRAKELKAAPVPGRLPVPTESAQLRALLEAEISGISQKAATAVRQHIAGHQKSLPAGTTSHESWLESGMPYVGPDDDCPFCGQDLVDKTLVDAYADFFSEAYKDLAAQVAKARETFARYESGDFRRAVAKQAEQNTSAMSYWREAARITVPELTEPSNLAAMMEKAAASLDAVFQRKQANLTASASDSEAALDAWSKGRDQIVTFNAAIDAYVAAVNELKEAIDESKLPSLENTLKLLNATKRRFESGVVAPADKLDGCRTRKAAIATEKELVRKELNEHGKAITEKLGQLINEYLIHLGAGFRIDYQEPNYQSKEPAASYHILINDHPVSPRADSLDTPSFRNTLSAGDKSTLALAFFLAKVRTDPELANAIIVLDDPFTSLDSARRQFTANEIKKLSTKAKQVIVLSHDKNFLRLLWDKIDHSLVSSIALQTGAPGMTTIAPFDIEAATQPRHVTERMKIQEFLDGEDHDPHYIRSRLRTVCEDFYRKGDPGLFRQAASLEEIIRNLENAPGDHPYKAALDNLTEINEYSRGDHHAHIEGNPHEDTTVEELKSFCRKVIELTRGL